MWSGLRQLPEPEDRNEFAPVDTADKREVTDQLLEDSFFAGQFGDSCPIVLLGMDRTRYRLCLLVISRIRLSSMLDVC